MSSRPTRRAAAAKRKPIVEEDSDDDDVNDSPPAQEESEDDFTPAPPKSARKSVGPATRRRKTTQPPLQTETPPSASSAGRRPGRARKSVARDTATAEPSVEPNTSIPDDSTSTVAPRRRGRPKKNAIKEETVEPEPIAAPSVEDSTMQPSIEQDNAADGTAMDVDQEEEEEPPIKKAPGRKRKSVAPRAASKAAKPAKEPTPAPAAEPEAEVEAEAQAQAQAQAEPPASSNPVSTPKPTATPEPAPEPERFQTPLADTTEAASNDQRRAVEDTLLHTVKPVKPLDTVLDKPMDIVLKSRTMVLPQVEDTTPKPRLVIRYLILNNFKSYAGRQEVGPFHASFSSVVGPNGSGKSNVIDSLLFVFGFRASKMRQGKLSALIHNSVEYPNLDHCEVAVHFQEVLDHVCPAPWHSLTALTDTLYLGSLAVATRSFPTPSSSYPARRSRTTPAVTTSMARRPTSPPSPPSFETAASISITSVSLFCRVRWNPLRR